MKKLLLCCTAILIISCKSENGESQKLKNGIYRVTMQLQDNEELPFNMEVTSPQTLKIFNADEVIEVDEIEYKNDSVFIKAPVFEGYFAGVFEDEILKGQFIKEPLERYVPFKAEYNNNERFEANIAANENVDGIWEMEFSPGVEADAYIAKGIFKQKGTKVTGTIRTTTGDYRYLDGIMEGNTLKLSTFDGAHVFLFTAKVSDSTLSGTFYSGNHWKEPFTAKRNPDYELPDANTLTFLKDGYDTLEFSFPNSKGAMVSLRDEQFKNKVVVVQIMGTWCPNCLDETKYYAEFYNNNRDKDIEFVALAFEYAKSEKKAFESIERLKNKISIEYPILLAQYGTSSKTEAQEKLPMLNHVLSYPTSIFIDKQGKVRKIHTGFNGPATGEKYTEFKEEFEAFVDELLRE